MKDKVKERRSKVVWGDVFPKSRLLLVDNGKEKRARVEGAKKLLLCLSGEIKIQLSEETLHFLGKDLSCTAYASGALEVSGWIFEIRFLQKGSEGAKR